MTEDGLALKMTVDEAQFSDSDFFQLIDLDTKELGLVKTALESRDVRQAKKELVRYFLNRTNVKGMYDFRNGKPAKEIMQGKPYIWQHYYSFNGSVWDYVERSVECLFSHQYLMASGQVANLGKQWDKFPVYSYEELSKINQGFHIRFTRGHMFELLGLYYQQTGKTEVKPLFSQLLHRFFEIYSLKVEDFDIHGAWMQYSHNREAMNVGWLAMTYLNLLHMDISYQLDTELTFSLIKRACFLSMQFKRYETDGYRPNNHHFFERGIVPYFAARMLPEFPVVKSMEPRAKQVINSHLTRDFKENGRYAEHSVGYWLGATVGEMLCKILVLNKNEGISLLEEQSEKNVGKMFEIAGKLAPEDGIYPTIGDQGGLRTDLIRSAAIDFGYPFGKGTDEKPKLSIYPQAGFAVGRDNGYYALMSVRDQVPGSGHDHVDMLSLILMIRGKRFFDETCAADLYKNFVLGQPPRGFLYNQTSHNTVLVHGRPVVPDEVLQKGWRVRKPNTVVDASAGGEDWFYLSAYHDGYISSRVKRELYYQKGLGTVVTDTVLDGNKLETPHIQRWFLASGVHYQAVGQKAFILTQENVKVMLLFYGDFLHCEISRPAFLEGFVSEENRNDVLDVSFLMQQSSMPEDRNTTLSAVVIDLADCGGGQAEMLAKELLEKMEEARASGRKEF